jgi:pimeloyl-ACP methyl ester carboxylesterase
VERRRGGHTLGPARVAVRPVVVPAGHRDRAIPPAGQRFMAERGNARIKEVAASHASMVSQPEAVTRLILSPSRRRAAASREGMTPVPCRRHRVDTPFEVG